MADRKAEELLAKLEFLKAEIDRKNKVLSLTKSVAPSSEVKEVRQSQAERKIDTHEENTREEVLATFQSLLGVAKQAGSPGFVLDLEASSSEDEGEYESLRNLVSQLSYQLEQEARKLALAWAGAQSDKEASRGLLKCMVQPAEGIVTALATISSSSKVVQVLRTTATTRAVEVCTVCTALLEGLGKKNLPPLAGAVEAVCENIRKLPISNSAAFKRQALEYAKTLADTQKEFEEIAESGKVDWGLPQDDEDENGGDQDDEDNVDGSEEIEEEDVMRIKHGCEVLASLKALLIAVGGIQDLETSEFNTLSEGLGLCVAAATDFGVELYPPQDTSRLVQKATALKHAVSDLDTSSGGGPDYAKALDDFHRRLNLLVV